MRRRRILTAATLACFMLAGGAAVSDEPAGRVLSDQQFKVVSQADESAEVGSYHLRSTSLEEGRKIEIVEEMTLDFRGKKVRFRSRVVYATAPNLTPLEGTAETSIDGQACMKGSVQLAEDSVGFSCMGLLNKRTLEKIDPPQEFKREGIPRPAGTLLFQSALPALGPQFVAAGATETVVFVEFPDDIGAPELVNMKSDYRLVRDKPDADGAFTIRLIGPNRDAPVSVLQFDKQGQLLDMASFGKFRMLPVELP